MRANKVAIAVFAFVFLSFGCLAPAQTSSQTASQNSSQTSTVNPHTVPAVDAGIGSCTADFVVNDESGKPVYAAKIKVHIAYGFGGFHKLDLEVGTNIDGKARFTGLPDRLKKGGLFFQASESDRTGDAFDDPAKTCQAQFPIVLRKPLN